ncbi:MAG: hypothetical protein ACLQMO_13150 [Acidobacteriaceae bacterium]
MAGAVSRVVSGSLKLPALFAPDKDAARRFIEFFTANTRFPSRHDVRIVEKLWINSTFDFQRAFICLISDC